MVFKHHQRPDVDMSEAKASPRLYWAEKPETGVESPPAYRQALFKSGPLQVKKEMSTPMKESSSRKWLPCHVSINGTQLVLISGKLLATTSILSLQYARVGLASDYTKVANCFRIRAEGQQYLFAASSLKEMLEWILALQIAIDLSLPIDLRSMPRLPSRRAALSYARSLEPTYHLERYISHAPICGTPKTPSGSINSRGCPPTTKDFWSLNNNDPWTGIIYYHGSFASVEQSGILPMKS
ncbi:hypothetical protein B9G98_03592 [Wickerhamiella sorbophila]|uniref:PH domain-containing protein n=1 Tax=Wickerhamiella sorbophila TaxID=45607 RepID=A0A2T0FLW5_9ASCO|nr:hypothetical protein B9G98_03592 [Wickerhamiella sorbophila]PRT55972.1 hypothetical protein B9G98_03592 [Wickerhamiella sorbophila]